MKKQSSSALTHVLLGLVPYTKQNLQLTFHPNEFFSELERTSGLPASTLSVALSRAKKRKLITIDNNHIELSLKARQTIQPYIATKLAGNARLMVIFDIPEDFAHKRRQLRLVLRQLKFEQIQQSVWMSDNDHRMLIEDIVESLHLGDWIQVYEAARLLPR